MTIRTTGPRALDFGAIKEQINGLIDQLSGLHADAQERQQIVNTLNDAQKVRDEADSYTAKVKEAADKILANAHDLNEQSQARLNEAASKEASLNKREKQLDDLANAIEGDKQSGLKAIAQDMSKLHAAQQALSVRESLLKAREDAVVDREKKLQERIDSLRKIQVD